MTIGSVGRHVLLLSWGTTRAWTARCRNRSRPCAASAPVKWEVRVRAVGASAPRMDMHRCSASSTTPTPSGSELRVEVVGDLDGEPLLQLESPREVLDDPGELGQPEQAGRGEVADVRDSAEREEVVGAQRGERDVVARAPGRRSPPRWGMSSSRTVRDGGVRDTTRRHVRGVSARLGSSRSCPSAIRSSATAFSARRSGSDAVCVRRSPAAATSPPPSRSIGCVLSVSSSRSFVKIYFFRARMTA